MDEKVLDLLINRVEDSSHWYTVHKNDAWKECLKSDKERLKKYIMKNVFEGDKLPDQFSFVIPSDEEGLIYTATRLNDKQFTVSWGTTSSLVFEESSIQRSLKDGSYIIKD